MKKRLEELKVPKEQLDKIEEEKQEVLAKAGKNAEDRKTPVRKHWQGFYRKQKRKYHKSRR